MKPYKIFENLIIYAFMVNVNNRQHQLQTDQFSHNIHCNRYYAFIFIPFANLVCASDPNTS